MVRQIGATPPLEVLMSVEEIQGYLLTVCRIASPIIIFNAKGKDIVDHLGQAVRCFSSLQPKPGRSVEERARQDQIDFEGDSPLPLQDATECIDTDHMSEFLYKFLESTKDHDLTYCRGISRHYVGKFRNKDGVVIGFYLVGPVTQLESGAKNCPLTSQSCPFALDDSQTEQLEEQLGAFRAFISDAYQTRARRLAQEDPSRLNFAPDDGTARKLDALREKVDEIFHQFCLKPRTQPRNQVPRSKESQYDD